MTSVNLKPLADKARMMCPNCGAVNRFSVYRVHDNPRCGRCHEPLSRASVGTARSNQLMALLECHAMPTVIGIWPQAQAHERLEKVFAQAACVLEGQAQLFHIDSGDDRFLRLGFQITEFPTILVLKDGHVLARRSGTRRLNDLHQWITALV